jgi:hypothetical protein
MPARHRPHARPAAIVAVLLCLVFQFVWDACVPALVGEPITVQLTRLRPQAEFDIPAGAIRAEVRESAGSPTHESLTFAFALEGAGRYSVWGISSNRAAQPLALRVNGRPTSAMAFHQRTGSIRADFERHRIARGVRMVAGRNVVGLRGARVRDRTLLLELRREAPLGVARYALLFAAAAAALGLRTFVVSRVTLPPPLRAATTAMLFALGLVAFPIALDRVSDGALSPLGEKDPVKTGRLRLMEERFAAAGRRPDDDATFRVFVMGDSTHYWSLPRPRWMVPTLQREIARRRVADVEIAGFAGGALNAFDFYLLMSRVVRERPDLVVIPVGMRGFSDWWLHNEGYRFHEMDHYPSFAELVRARKLSVAGRELSGIGWALRSLDAHFQDGRVAHLLRGAKVWLDAERDRVAFLLTARWFGSAAPPAAAKGFNRWNTAIPADHPLFEAYRLINELARRNGVAVLYYSEPANVEAQRRKGRDLRIAENFAVIEAAIADASGVTFLGLADETPPEIFSDDIDHLTPEGIAGVAKALAAEIEAIKKRRGTR